MLFIALLACTGGNESSADGAPSITLISPTDGAVVCGTPLEVVADVENFRLTNETIEDPPPDLGHLHVYLNGQEEAQADTTTVELNDIPDAEYQLKLDLALADHTALNPYVATTIYITVDNAVCGQ